MKLIAILNIIGLKLFGLLNASILVVSKTPGGSSLSITGNGKTFLTEETKEIMSTAGNIFSWQNVSLVTIVLIAGILALNYVRLRTLKSRRKLLYNGSPFLGIERKHYNKIKSPFERNG